MRCEEAGENTTMFVAITGLFAAQGCSYRVMRKPRMACPTQAAW
ncbi:hypothetical protein PSN_4007 [Pseudomonas sp. NGC7]